MSIKFASTFLSYYDNSMDNRPVGVFDSGIGGLSILRELRAVLPYENYVFLADQLHVPYGEKTKKQLENLTGRISRFLITRDVKLIVVACNTATCYAIEYLRNKFKVPFVGTVPAVKPAAEQTKTKVIAVLSTPATARSLALKRLVRQYGRDVTVLRIGCPGLEDAVEFGNTANPETLFLLKKYLSKVLKSGVDQIVLGCTHYPFLKKSIASVAGSAVNLVDSGEAIARHTAFVLSEKRILNNAKRTGRVLYFTTGEPYRFSKVATDLLKEEVLGKKVRI